MQVRLKPARVGRNLRGQGSEAAAQLAELGNRFDRFREKHPRGSRIPVELRDAVLALLEQGAGGRAVEKACGVSWGQIRAWQGRVRRAPRKTVVDEERARVFAVVNEEGGVRGPPAAFAEQALELRLGPWSVSVRLAEMPRGGGG